MVTCNHTSRRLCRADRARRIFEFGKVHPTGTPGCYRVESDSQKGGSYRVEFNQKGWVYCSCLDWKRSYDRSHDVHETTCKHAMAASLYRAAIRDAFRPHRELSGVA